MAEETRPTTEAGTKAAAKGGKGIEGIVDKVPGGWLTVGIGLVAIVIAYMTYQAIQNQGGTTTLTPVSGGGGTPTAVTDQGTTPVDTNAGGSVDYTSAIQGLTSAEQQMAQSLQTFYNQTSAAQGASPVDNGSGPGVSNLPPKSTGSHGSNQSTLQAYLQSVGLGSANVQYVGKGAQSGYVISGVSGINKSQLLSEFGAGWTVTSSGGKYLLKGPGATKVMFKNGKVVT